MFQKITVLFHLVMSITCMILHPQPPPVLINLQYNDDPNYTFAYDVNDPNTGDVKNQHESRRGDIVLGQYQLVQPDGVLRTVEYRADDHRGFQATVNNEARPTVAPALLEPSEEPAREPNLSVHPSPVHVNQPWPSSYSTTTITPVAISRTSFQQTITNTRNPWI
ncbi:hypothetical protein ACJJTC_012016 [Scirpophaga incertulas]